MIAIAVATELADGREINLIVKVLSESVSKALTITGCPEASETAKFVLMMDTRWCTQEISRM